MQMLFEYLKCLEERHVVTDVSQISVPSSGGIQITFLKSAGKAQDNKVVIDGAADAFGTKISRETKHDVIEVGEGKRLNVYSQEDAWIVLAAGVLASKFAAVGLVVELRHRLSYRGDSAAGVPSY